MKELEVITDILNKALETNSKVDRATIVGLLYLIIRWYHERDYNEYYDRVYGMAWGLESVGIITIDERNKIFDCLLKGYNH